MVDANFALNFPSETIGRFLQSFVPHSFGAVRASANCECKHSFALHRTCRETVGKVSARCSRMVLVLFGRNCLYGRTRAIASKYSILHPHGKSAQSTSLRVSASVRAQSARWENSASSALSACVLCLFVWFCRLACEIISSKAVGIFTV